MLVEDLHDFGLGHAGEVGQNEYRGLGPDAHAQRDAAADFDFRPRLRIGGYDIARRDDEARLTHDEHGESARTQRRLRYPPVHYGEVLKYGCLDALADRQRDGAGAPAAGAAVGILLDYSSGGVILGEYVFDLEPEIGAEAERLELLAV